MSSTIKSVNIKFGMVNIEVNMSKATEKDRIKTQSLCGSCGSEVRYLSDDEGNRIECKECNERYKWWNSKGIEKGYKIGDDYIELTKEEIKEAKERAKEDKDVGEVVKASPIKEVIDHYNLGDQYYLVPNEDMGEFYGAIVKALQDEDIAFLTYISIRSRAKRYAIISENNRLIAIELRDMREPPEIDFEIDETKVSQTKMLLDNLKEKNPHIPDIDQRAIKNLIENKQSQLLEETEKQKPKVEQLQ